jgi:hypothetical protein
VLAGWTITVAATLLGSVLWFVQGVVRGVPGPILSGLYLTGAVDAVIVVAYAAIGVVLATIAAILVARVPGNAIGWILGAVALWLAMTFLVIMCLYFLDTRTGFANWLGEWSFVIPTATSLVLMLFPTGRLLSRRWLPLPWLAILGTVSWAVAEATKTTLGVEQALPNPYAHALLNDVANLTGLAVVPALAGTVASLVIRYRRSPVDVRLQIKWVAFGGTLGIGVWLLIWAWWAIRPDTFGSGVVALGTLSVLLTPVALAVAILRHRLYDIDRLVSRTVSYAVLAAVLGGSYAVGVIGLQTLFPSSGSLAVAGTTLALAAAFNPLRRRLHDLMDRRFNRRHFDTVLVLEAFAARVVTVGDTEELSAGLTSVLEQTLAPATIAIWIRPQAR